MESDIEFPRRRPSAIVRLWVWIKCSFVSKCCSKESIRVIEDAERSTSTLTNWNNMSIA